jgi:hypothetical protein
MFYRITEFTKLGSLTHPQRSQRGSWGLNKAKTQLETSTSSEEELSELDVQHPFKIPGQKFS